MPTSLPSWSTISVGMFFVFTEGSAGGSHTEKLNQTSAGCSRRTATEFIELASGAAAEPHTLKCAKLIIAAQYSRACG